MSEDDNQVPSALVAVGTKALAVRSAALIKRGLALAKSLPRLESGLRAEPEPSKEQLEHAIRFLMGIDQDGTEQDGAESEAHASLGFELLESNPEEAILQFREVIRLYPNNDVAHANLAFALAQKGDVDGEIAEYREALRLNPNLALAHNGLGSALGNKGDTDGQIAEYREALRLHPNSGYTHYNLGYALEHKHEPWAALQEYRAAYELNPQNPDYRKAYERLAKKSSQ
jgi:tetratricopeptide (TPR) repeat protein